MKKIALLFLSLSLMIFTQVSKSVYAIDELDISVSPPIIEIKSTPPALAEADIEIENLNENAHDFNINIIPFKQDNPSSQKIEHYSVLSAPSLEIEDKIIFFDGEQEIKSLHLAPLSKKKITMKIMIENNSKPADYYFSVVFTSQDSFNQEAYNTKISSGIGVNVLLSVGESITPNNIHIESFTSKTFYEKGPASFKLLISNKNKHVIRVNGSVIIKNLFGQTIGSLELLPQYILADSKKYMTDINQAQVNQSREKEEKGLLWPEKNLYGIYTAKAYITFSDKIPPKTKDIIFFAFPIIPSLVATIVLFMVLGISLRVNKIIRNKRISHK